MPRLTLQKRIDKALDEFMRPINSTNAPLLREALKEWLADRKLTIVEEK